MAVQMFEMFLEMYNYESFSRSESAGKSNEFKNSLRAGTSSCFALFRGRNFLEAVGRNREIPAKGLLPRWDI